MTPAELRAAFFRTFPAVGLSIVLGAIDQTIVATALPAIAGGLALGERLSWVVVVWLLAATIAAPVHGRLGDAFGRKRQLLISLGLTAGGAAIAGSAEGFATLMLGRALQGAGGGGLATLTMALIGEAVPPRERGRFQAWIAGSFVLASTTGPLLGGVLTAELGWRAVFWAQVPACGLAAVLALRLPRRVPDRPPGFRFDLLGALLFAGCITPALLALSALRRPAVPVLVEAAGLVLFATAMLAALLWWERRARDPLLPLHMLGQPGVWRTNLFTALGHGTTVALVSFLPLYFVAARGVPPATAGLLLLPIALGGGLGGLTGGRLMAATGAAAPLAALGLAGAASVLGAVAWLAPALPEWGIALLFGGAVFGVGLSYPISQILVQVAAGPALLGAAAASVQYARTLGAAAGTALLGVALFSAAAGGSAGFEALLREGPDLLARLPAEDAGRLQAALGEAFGAAFAAAAALAAAGGIVAARTPIRRI